MAVLARWIPQFAQLHQNHQRGHDREKKPIYKTGVSAVRVTTDAELGDVFVVITDVAPSKSGLSVLQ